MIRCGAMSTATTLLTAEEFEARYADGPPCELVRGEVVELTAGGLRHSRITGLAYYLIEAWARRTGSGRAYAGESGLIIERGPDTVRGADVAYFSFQRFPTGREPTGFSKIAPELVVEVVGKGQGWDTMVEKTAEYLAMGVSRVWVLDPKGQTLHIFGGDAAPVELQGNELVRDEAILPGFFCRAAQFFQD